MLLNLNLGYKYSNLTICAIFFVCPILVLPQIISRSINGVKGCQNCLAIFIGLLSILAWPPRADVYRHAMTFYEIQNMTFTNVMNEYFRGDVVLLFMQYYFGKIGLSFEIIRFVFIIFPYILFFNLYNSLISINTLSYKNKIYLFFIIVLSVPFATITYGLRYALSVTVLGYYILKTCLTNKSNILDKFLIVLAPLIHFGCIWLVLTIFIKRLLSNNLSKSIFIVAFILFTLLSIYAESVLSYLASDIFSERLINFYINTEEGEENIKRNLFGMLPIIINYSTYYLYLLLTIIFIPYNKSTKILFLIFILCAFTSALPLLFVRIWPIVLVIGGIFAFRYINCKKLLCAFLCITSLIPAITGWRGYTISNIGYIVSPVPIALCQNYDYHWLRNNLTEEGTLIVYIRK